MKHISKILPEVSPKITPSPKTCKYINPRDDPDYVEPTKEEVRKNWLLKYGGVTDLQNTFDKMRHPKGFEQTFTAFRDMAKGEVGWSMLMVYGSAGNGKTKCCEAVVIELYNRGIRAQREKWSDIIRFTLKASFSNKELGQPTYAKQFAKLRGKQFLIIDDVGMGSTGGNWEWGELEDIVDYRLENGLFTIITTNLDIKAVPPRIVSRFRDSQCRLICNEAPDQRPMRGKR